MIATQLLNIPRPRRIRPLGWAASVLCLLASLLPLLTATALPSLAVTATTAATYSYDGGLPLSARTHPSSSATMSAGPAASAPVVKADDGLTSEARTGFAADSVMLDSSTARAIASDTKSAVRSRLMAQIGERNMVMTRTAADEFQGAVSRLAGPMEKSRR